MLLIVFIIMLKVLKDMLYQVKTVIESNVLLLHNQSHNNIKIRFSMVVYDQSL